MKYRTEINEYESVMRPTKDIKVIDYHLSSCFFEGALLHLVALTLTSLKVRVKEQSSHALCSNVDQMITSR